MQRQLASASTTKDGYEESEKEQEEVNSACSTQPPSPRSTRTDSSSAPESSESQSAMSTTSSEPPFLETESSDTIDCERGVVVQPSSESPRVAPGIGEGG